MSHTETPCRYMTAAYPGWTDACEFGHRHDQRVFDLARAMAVAMQPAPTTDERIAWFLDDADEVVDDFDPAPAEWAVESLGEPTAEFLGCDEEDVSGYRLTHALTINGRKYIVQDSDFDPAHPVALDTFLSWHAEETL